MSINNICTVVEILATAITLDSGNSIITKCENLIAQQTRQQQNMWI
jgi:hypothetical protein